MKKLISMLLIAAMVFAFCACGNTAKEESTPSEEASVAEENVPNEETVVIKMGYTQGTEDPEGSDEVRYGTAFKEYVESHCDTIKVELYPSGQLGNANDVVGSIVTGTVQMGVYEASLLNNYDPDTMVFILPGVFNDFSEVNAIIDSDWGKDLLAASSEKTGMMVLGGSCKGMRSFTVKGHELRTVDDIKGLTFRVMDSPMYIQIRSTLLPSQGIEDLLDCDLQRKPHLLCIWIVPLKIIEKLHRVIACLLYDSHQ